jgi:hypothetical protein
MEVRVRNGDEAQPTESLDHLRQAVIQKWNAVPQNISTRAAYQQSALSNADLRIHTDTDDPGTLRVHRVSMPFEPIMRSPLLAMEIHVLPFIETDFTALRRALRLSVLSSALRANIVLQCCSPRSCYGVISLLDA